ncbi:MAG: helix-turn-helix domain-containing protein [Cyclobacteriaceae bacterium]
MKIEQLKITNPSEIIHNAWIIDLEKERAAEGYYFFPDNQAEILIALKGNLSRRIVGHRRQHPLMQGESILAKTRSRGMVLQADEDITVLLVKLHPQYLNSFSKSPNYRFRDEVQKFIIPGRYMPDWKTAIFYKDKEALIDIIGTYVDELSDSNKNLADKLIQETIDLIRKQKGEIKIKDLNEMLGICKSTLEQKFNREIGISPKEFCKIEKLCNFLKNYNEFAGEMTLTQLTFKSGYYDQSHLIKDFKYYVDDSPKRFLNNANTVLLYA